MKNIIFVEDDTDIRELVGLALDPTQYHVMGYESGELIMNGQAEAPDLFLLDKNIAGTSGLDICRFIKSSERYEKVPVLILSASPNVVEIAREAGADGAIEKPFSLTDLRNTLEKYTMLKTVGD